MNRKTVLFFVSFVAIFAAGPLTVWGDHAGWSGLQMLATIGVLGTTAAGVLSYLLSDEAITRPAKRDENGGPVPLDGIEREVYGIFGHLPTTTSKR